MFELEAQLAKTEELAKQEIEKHELKQKETLELLETIESRANQAVNAMTALKSDLRRYEQQSGTASSTIHSMRLTLAALSDEVQYICNMTRNAYKVLKGR